MFRILIVAFAVSVCVAGAQSQQQPAQQSAPGNLPTQPAQTNTPTNATPNTAARHAPEAKSQEEYAAFKQAMQQQDPDEFAKQADSFSARYPQSELQGALYQELTRRFFSANKPDQVLLYGRKTLKFEPDNPVALACLARAIAESTQANDIDHDERLAEAIKDAQQMISTIDQSLPTIVAAKDLPEVKRRLLFMAWDAQGKAQLELKQDASAQKSLEKALDYAPDEALTRLRLALALDRQQRYSDAMAAIERTLQSSKDDPEVTQQAEQEKSRLQQLIGSAPGGPAQALPSSKPPERLQ